MLFCTCVFTILLEIIKKQLFCVSNINNNSINKTNLIALMYPVKSCVIIYCLSQIVCNSVVIFKSNPYILTIPDVLQKWPTLLWEGDCQVNFVETHYYYYVNYLVANRQKAQDVSFAECFCIAKKTVLPC